MKVRARSHPQLRGVMEATQMDETFEIAGAWRWNQKRERALGEGGWGLCRCLEGGLLKGECELGAAGTALCCPRWVRA